MSPKIKILIKHNTKISNSFGWVSFTSKESDKKHGKVTILAFDVHGLWGEIQFY